MKVTSIETLACDAGWRNYHFVKLTTSDGIVGWSEFSEDFGSPGIGAVIAQARRQGHRSERERSRAHLCGALCGDASGRRRRRGAGDRRDRERAARCQGEGARRAGLRAARRQAARPHSALLVALRDVAHQSSDLLQAGDHRSRRREGDRPRGAREGLSRRQDQHLHLRGRQAARLPAGLRLAVLSRAQHRQRRCCAICTCISKRCATGSGRSSACCSISTSTPRPKAI